MTSRLVFSARQHTYSLDGKRVPGVTTVINRATDKPALVHASAREAATWAAANVDSLPDLGPDAWIRQAAAAPRDIWNGKAKRGTLLHEAAHQLLTGEPLQPIDAHGNLWPDDVIRSAEQLARFMDEWDAEPVVAESAVFHEDHRWAGTLDLVADCRDGRRWLLDYKTGETGIYPKDALQLAAYRHATHMQVITDDAEWADVPMVPVDEAACVWVRPDFYEVRPVTATPEAYEVFRHMLPVAAWSTWDREASVSDPLPVPAAVA